MKKKNIIIISSIIGACILIAIITIIILCVLNKSDENNTADENAVAQEENVTEENSDKNQDDVMVVNIGAEDTNQVAEENTEEEVQTPAMTTQEIYSMNSVIGHLTIPKTGLDTDVYSNVTVDIMEQMPCFLYTTGGLNNVGVTLIVGHNRENGLLFSNNNLLEENDVFYFTDFNGTQKEYTIYSKFVTTDDDISFLEQETDKPIIALSCCIDNTDTDMRTVILGKAE